MACRVETLTEVLRRASPDAGGRRTGSNGHDGRTADAGREGIQGGEEEPELEAVGEVALLKIDVEHHEVEVLRGVAPRLWPKLLQARACPRCLRSLVRRAFTRSLRGYLVRS